MSSTRPVLFPCPKCGNSRVDLGATCGQCGWSPDSTPIATKHGPQPMGKSAAMILGFVTAIPIAYMFFFFLVFFLLAFGGGNPSNQSFMFIFVMHVLVILLIWVLIAFYIWHLFKSDVVPNDKKALWAVVLFLGNMIAMPVFWYIYIWKPAQRES